MTESAETAVLAGGCAWIMQQPLRPPEGVRSTRVGWTGGKGDNPSEEAPRPQGSKQPFPRDRRLAHSA